MMYKKIVFDGNILGVSEVEKGGNITADDFERLTAIINNMPTAPDGYYYVLRDSDEEWELIKTPEPPEEEATAEDYENALADLGVRV